MGAAGAARRRLLCALAVALGSCLVISWVSGAAAGGEPALTQATAPAGKVLVVVIDRIGIDDVTQANAPNLMGLIRRGAVSLMNARVKYDQYGLGSYLVIGAGGRALGGPNIALAFNSGERLKTSEGGTIRAGDIYKWRVGRRAPAGGTVNLYIEEMQQKSDTPQASSKPGLLGQALRGGGKRVAVVGNADSLIPASPVDVTPLNEQRVPQTTNLELAEPPGAGRTTRQTSYPLQSLIHREVVSIAMDERGAVPSGDVVTAMTGVFTQAGGVQTDFAKLEQKTGALLPASDLVVVDTGQTSRVDEQADFFSEAELDAARAGALRESDAALGRLAGMLDLDKDVIVVCAPTPTQKMILEGELLTPVVIAGRGFDKGNRLHSPTTRRTGLVSNYDIAPTILASLGLKSPAEMDGRALSTAGSSPDIAGLKAFRDKAVSAFNARKALVRVYVITSMCVIALFFLVMLIRRDLISDHPFFWSAALLTLLAGPLVWLAVPAMGAVPQWALITVAVCGSIVAGLASLLLRDRKGCRDDSRLSSVLARPMLAISGVTLLLIIVDALTGSPLMTFSAFGSDVILADRYYGIGNLYMGFAVGSAVLFTCLVIQFSGSGLDRRWKRYAFAVAVLGVTTLVIGLPQVGANVGGLITIMVAALVTLMRLEGKPLTARRVAVVVLVLVVCVGALLLVDALMPGTGSHAGRAVTKIQSGGLPALVSQVSRKLGANWSLTWTSIWRLLLLFAVVAWLVFNWRFSVLRVARARYPYLQAGFAGMAVALVVAWVFNDSGIEAAAAISVFLFVPYFLMLIPWGRRQIEENETG
jgi:hypothetical protein